MCITRGQECLDLSVSEMLCGEGGPGLSAGLRQVVRACCFSLTYDTGAQKSF